MSVHGPAESAHGLAAETGVPEGPVGQRVADSGDGGKQEQRGKREEGGAAEGGRGQRGPTESGVPARAAGGEVHIDYHRRRQHQCRLRWTQGNT